MLEQMGLDQLIEATKEVPSPATTPTTTSTTISNIVDDIFNSHSDQVWNKLFDHIIFTSFISYTTWLLRYVFL